MIAVMTDHSRIVSALSYIPAHDRDMWVKIGCAVKSELPDEDGFSAWNDWSQTADNYKENNAISVWRSINISGGIGIGTLFKISKDNGWQDTGAIQILTTEEINQRAAERAKRDESDRKKKMTASNNAMKKADLLWRAAKPINN